MTQPAVPPAPSAAERPASACGPQSLDTTGEKKLGQAIAQALEAPPEERADLLERLTGEITALTTAPGCDLRPWTRTVLTGTDGSRIFRGGLGFSIVVDPQGRLWRAGTVEDFETTYAITPTSCEIVAMKPNYAPMREYTRRSAEGELAAPALPLRRNCPALAPLGLGRMAQTASPANESSRDPDRHPLPGRGAPGV